MGRCWVTKTRARFASVEADGALATSVGVIPGDAGVRRGVGRAGDGSVVVHGRGDRALVHGSSRGRCPKPWLSLRSSAIRGG